MCHGGGAFIDEVQYLVLDGPRGGGDNSYTCQYNGTRPIGAQGGGSFIGGGIYMETNGSATLSSKSNLRVFHQWNAHTALAIC